MHLSDGSWESLLAQAIDYAGLFPPASLSLALAASNYDSYLRSRDAWALGRFIVPEARAGELLDLLEKPGERSGWRIGLTLGEPAGLDRDRLDSLQSRARDLGVTLDSFEIKVESAAAVGTVGEILSARGIWYAEVDSRFAPHQPAVLDALVRHGGRAKLRLGGVTADAFPAPERVAEFLIAVTQRRLPFKATAGLHHPIRGRYRLRYDDDAPVAMMYGYLNLFAAVAAAQTGASRSELIEVLLETDPAVLLGAPRSGVGAGFEPGAVARLRRGFDGFGSCSFREPIDELALAVNP
jgi:hypothetical protein